jgi:hypothetical protein
MNSSSKLRALGCLAFSAAIIFVQPAHAILDTNNNGLSDLWEKQYNNGNLFPNTFLATNDEDQDGWTNAKEAIAGTDPFQANPPDGIVAVEITPSLVPGAFTLTWPTLIGKNYQLKVSTDLVTWTNLGDPITTTQNTHTIGINTTQSNNSIPDKVFWQVTVTDFDTDFDGLTDAEENKLGTNPFNPDTDGDGLFDGWEIENSIDPNDADSDDDGITDGGEIDQGTDPNDPNDTPEAEWLLLTGDFGKQIKKSASRKITIPAGQSRVIVIGIASEEYPIFTGDESEFNDTLEWNILSACGQELSGNIDVNARHNEWIDAEIEGFGLQSYFPAHIENSTVINAPDNTPLTIEIQLSATNIADGLLPSTIMVGLLPVRTEPDADQSGKTGNQIPSNKGLTGDKHFVSPRKNSEIADEHVVLKVAGIDQDLFVKLLSWEGGIPHPADPLKRLVKRDKPAKTEVRVKHTPDDTEVAKMNVWVIWATMHGRVQGAGFSANNDLKMEDYDMTQLGAHELTFTREFPQFDGTTDMNHHHAFISGIEWRADIEPKAMFQLAEDIPDLTQVTPKDQNPPLTFDEGRTYYTHWDVSRDRKLKRILDGVVEREEFDWKIDDDTNYTRDEDPYEQATEKEESGEIYSIDGPGADTIKKEEVGEPMVHLPNGNVFEVKHVFKEWARVRLASKWYNISEKADWYSNVKINRTNGIWSTEKNEIGLGIQQ